MRISLWLCLAASRALLSLALHSSEAGLVDWHKPLIGVPLTGNPATSPVFHRTGESDGPTQSVLLTATASNVLAALRPENGSIAWRYLFEDDDRILVYRKHQNVVAALSGPGGAMLRLLDVNAGHLLLETRLHAAELGRLAEPDSTGTEIVFDSHANTHLYLLTNGHTVRRIHLTTGEVQWGWTSPDQTSSVIYSRIIATPSAVYLVGLTKSFASYTVHVTALSSESGEVLSEVDIPSNISNGLSDLLVVSQAGQNPRVVWLEQGNIKSMGLTTKLQEKPTAMKRAVYKELIDIGLSEYGQIVAIKEDGSGRVIKLGDQDSPLKVIWEFKDSASSNQHTESFYSGGLDKEGRPYIARVFWSHVFRKASAHVFAGHLADGKGLVTGFTFPFATSEHGIIGHVAIDAANPEEFRVLSRIVTTSTTGAIQLWVQDQLQWTREEGLADIKVAEFVELPETKVIASRVGEGETFGSRLRRQLSEAQDFPQYAVNFAKRFVTGSYESVSASAAPATNDTRSLSRDTFGFRQVIVAATAHGKVYGIDSSNGQVLWSRVFGLGWAAEVGGRIFPLKLFVTRTVADGEKPQVVLVTQRKADNSLVDTVLFHINALTGEDARDVPVTDVLEGHDIIAGPLVEAYFFRNDTTKYVVLFDEFLQTHIYPDTPENKQAFENIVPSVHFPLRTGSPGSRRLVGHRLSLEKEFTGRHVAYPIWTASLPPAEDITALITRPSAPVASLGKVLGNRTTLYKYLNPNLVALITTSPNPATPSCSIYVLDGVKGTIIYHVALPAVNGECDIKANFVENWLVYHYYDNDMAGVGQAKSHRMVSVEFYEGAGVDDKTSSSDLTSYSNQTTHITVFEQAYVIPHGIHAIKTTNTKFGITTKDVIIASPNRAIQSIPRRFLDPRRPNRKPTNEEAEEWLIQYDPLLPDDPRRMLSHTYQVARTRNIITAPALLESTSLVLSYGLDLFHTRVAPSNTFDVLSESFNKAQLVLTVAGLALAIVITKPMVGRKRLRERWYD